VKRKAKICGHDWAELLKLAEPRVLAAQGDRLLVLLPIGEGELRAASAGLALAARALRVGPFLESAAREPERSAPRRRARRRSTGRR
jgi:hypothetical protein